MTTRTPRNRPQHPAYESARPSRTRQRKIRNRTSESGNAPAGLYLPVMTDESFFEHVGRLREELEIRIEQMISLLDQLDGDPDLEPSTGDGRYPDEEEPDNTGGEGVTEDDEPDGDLEPWLGWTIDGVHGLLADGESAAELSIAELDERRARHQLLHGGVIAGDYFRLVTVTGGKLGNVRPLTPAQRSRYLAGIRADIAASA